MLFFAQSLAVIYLDSEEYQFRPLNVLKISQCVSLLLRKQNNDYESDGF